MQIPTSRSTLMYILRDVGICSVGAIYSEQLLHTHQIRSFESELTDPFPWKEDDVRNLQLQICIDMN